MTESTAFDHPRSMLKERLKGLLVRILFSHAVSGGRAHVRYLEQLGFPCNRVARFYDVVGNSQIETACVELRLVASPAQFGLPDEYFLYVGRLAQEKNVHGLLDAWHTYRKQGGRWSLVIVGDGPNAASLLQATQASSFSGDVYFPGLKTSHEILPYFAFANCFVLPSTREPWGLVVNEAMAASLPVLVSNRCGCAEDLVVAGQNGHVFDPLHQDELTDCLHTLEGSSQQRRYEMGQRSSCIVRNYSPENFGGEIAAIRDRTDRSPSTQIQESAT